MLRSDRRSPDGAPDTPKLDKAHPFVAAAWRTTRRHMVAGIGIIALLVCGVGGWAVTTDIAGAVLAHGLLVVESNVKKVQHPTGGIVGEVRVRDGDRVKAGDIVVRLDETITRANLSIVNKALVEFMARKARLEAERNGATAIAFPSDLINREADPAVEHVMNGERILFDLRRTSRTGQQGQLRQRIAQLKEEITGLLAQTRAKAQETTLIQRELAGARELWEKNLMPITKLTALEREAARLEGESAQLSSLIAQANGKIAETELQIIQIDRDLASEVGRELRDADARIGEYIERKVAAEDQLRRIDIRAPQDGKVHQSTVHTVGGVIAAGETLMLIVPDSDTLLVEARVAPQDIDQLRLRQDALLRLTAFSQRTTPEITGKLTRISADVTSDQRSTGGYYTVRISLSREEVARLGDVRLVPGMPVEVFIKTGDRTVISYLMKPMHDQIMRSFRER